MESPQCGKDSLHVWRLEWSERANKTTEANKQEEGTRLASSLGKRTLLIGYWQGIVMLDCEAPFPL